MGFTGVVRNSSAAAEYLNGSLISGSPVGYGEIQLLEGITLRSLCNYPDCCPDVLWESGDPWDSEPLAEDMKYKIEAGNLSAELAKCKAVNTEQAEAIARLEAALVEALKPPVVVVEEKPQDSEKVAALREKLAAMQRMAGECN